MPFSGLRESHRSFYRPRVLLVEELLRVGPREEALAWRAPGSGSPHAALRWTELLAASRVLRQRSEPGLERVDLSEDLCLS